MYIVCQLTTIALDMDNSPATKYTFNVKTDMEYIE